ncbi:hypothetical protein Leryth_016417 [Lithospermum erythrorhizon]|nr:hypothetical protein Leryth_016417 [Lithospermum erythrorhizon]
MTTSSFFIVLVLINWWSWTFADQKSFDPDNNNKEVRLNMNINGTKPKDSSLADIIDRALEKEFTETDDHSQANDAGSFNNSVAEQQAVLETVARVRPKKNDTKEEKFQLHHVFNNDNGVEDTPTLIDRKDNVFIISNIKSKYPVLQLDLRLISDLVVVIVSATCGGIAFACAGQPVITGYLLAGSLVGPGGFNFVSEIVQVCICSHLYL